MAPAFALALNDKKSCHSVLTNIVVNDMMIMTRKVVKQSAENMTERRWYCAFVKSAKGISDQAGSESDGTGEAGGRIQADHQPD